MLAWPAVFKYDVATGRQRVLEAVARPDNKPSAVLALYDLLEPRLCLAVNGGYFGLLSRYPKVQSTLTTLRRNERRQKWAWRTSNVG